MSTQEEWDMFDKLPESIRTIINEYGFPIEPVYKVYEVHGEGATLKGLLSNPLVTSTHKM